MARRTLSTPSTPMEQRALELAETVLEASGLRYLSGQIPGLARILMVFAEHEIRRAGIGTRTLQERLGRLAALQAACTPPLNGNPTVCACGAPPGQPHAHACPVWQDIVLAEWQTDPESR